MTKGKEVSNSIFETDYEKGLTDRELKRECFLYARENFQNRAVLRLWHQFGKSDLMPLYCTALPRYALVLKTYPSFLFLSRGRIT